jgi:hypothetical protein
MAKWIVDPPGRCFHWSHKDKNGKPQKLTIGMIKKHQCLEKQCPFLRRFWDHPYWQQVETAAAATREHKEARKIARRKAPII